MFDFVKSIYFDYHPWSIMYAIAFIVAGLLLFIATSEWYLAFANRKQDIQNSKQGSKYGKLLYNKLVFVCKATMILAVFCFFMTNFNQKQSLLILSASCGELKSPREGKMYVEDLANDCRNQNKDICFKKVLAKIDLKEVFPPELRS